MLRFRYKEETSAIMKLSLPFRIYSFDGFFYCF